MYLPSGLKRSCRKRQFFGCWGCGSDLVFAGAGASWPRAFSTTQLDTSSTITAIFLVRPYLFDMWNSASRPGRATENIIVYEGRVCIFFAVDEFGDMVLRERRPIATVL